MEENFEVFAETFNKCLQHRTFIKKMESPETYSDAARQTTHQDMQDIQEGYCGESPFDGHQYSHLEIRQRKRTSQSKFGTFGKHSQSK